MKDWEDIENIWDAEFEPASKHAWITYRISIDGVRRMYLYAEVDDYGMLQIGDMSYFNGKKFGDMDYNERREVYDYLTEWEFATWRRIGPEDSELFATRKLSPEYGVE